MHILHRKAYLREPLEYLVLAEVLDHSVLACVLLLLLYPCGEVPTLRVLHDDAQLLIPRFVHILEANDVGVPRDAMKHLDLPEDCARLADGCGAGFLDNLDSFGASP